MCVKDNCHPYVVTKTKNPPSGDLLRGDYFSAKKKKCLGLALNENGTCFKLFFKQG
jgi:hypothetical protein